jgi:hypothetical protein
MSEESPQNPVTRRIIFHLGYPKTGTTYLQRRVFSQLADGFAVVTPEFQNCGINIRRFKREVQRGAVPERLRQSFLGKDVLISMEGLLLDPIRDVRSVRAAGSDFRSALAGLRSLLADSVGVLPTIVIYLRAQDELIHSLYAESKAFQFDRVPELDTFPKYVEAVLAEARDPRDAGFFYDFNNTLAQIREVFPDCEPQIRFYEDLEMLPHAEVAFWSRIAGRSLVYVDARDNTRRGEANGRTTDPRNRFRFALIGLKDRLLPNLKLPNGVAFGLKRLLAALPSREPELIPMSGELRSRIRAKFCPLNQRAPVQCEIPPHLRATYFRIDAAQ